MIFQSGHDVEEIFGVGCQAEGGDLALQAGRVLAVGLALLVDGDKLHTLDIPMEVMKRQAEDNQDKRS